MAARPLHAAVRRHAGEAAFIQRCQVHKKRNVIDHLPQDHKADVKRKLQNAYAMAEYADAMRALDPAPSRTDGHQPERRPQPGGRWKKRSPFTDCACRNNCAGPLSSTNVIE